MANDVEHLLMSLFMCILMRCLFKFLQKYTFTQQFGAPSDGFVTNHSAATLLLATLTRPLEVCSQNPVSVKANTSGVLGHAQPCAECLVHLNSLNPQTQKKSWDTPWLDHFTPSLAGTAQLRVCTEGVMQGLHSSRGLRSHRLHY